MIDFESLLGKIIAVAGGPAGETLEEAYRSTLNELAKSADANARALALQLYLEMILAGAFFDAATQVLGSTDGL